MRGRGCGGVFRVHRLQQDAGQDVCGNVSVNNSLSVEKADRAVTSDWHIAQSQAQGTCFGSLTVTLTRDVASVWDGKSDINAVDICVLMCRCSGTSLENVQTSVHE